MAELEDRDGLIAEYVLGTLDVAERRELEAAMDGDAGLRRLAEDWERRLAPLALALEPVAVPGHVKAKVLAAVAGGSANAGNVGILERRVRRWRAVTLATWVTAAALAGVIFLKPPPVLEAGRYVAVLQSEGPGPAFLASVDLARGTISVRAVSATIPAGKSYELWALGAGRDKPQSLGVIAADFRIPAGRLGKTESGELADTVFAVSLEPEGGSPTGQPTGPVLFTGKLVATE